MTEAGDGVALADYERPETRLLPVPGPESTPFWTGGRDGQLLIFKCASCGHFFHPPGPVCWRCRSTDVSPQPASGRAHVASYTINRQPWIPGYAPPYVVAMVELDDEPDVRLVTNVIGVPIEAVTIGMAVEVVFERWPAEGDDDTAVWLPLFRPVVDNSTSGEAR